MGCGIALQILEPCRVSSIQRYPWSYNPKISNIFFVGDEGFRDLSQVDPKGNELLQEAISNDKSDEWFNKKGRSKVTE